MISIGVSEGRSALEAIAGDWKCLVGDSFSTAFSQPAWYLAWLDTFPAKNIAVVTAREGDRLVGVLPLSRTRTDARGMYFTQVAPIARGDYQPPLIAAEFAETALPPMVDAAIRHFGRRGVFWWPNIPVTDISIELLRNYFRSRGMPWVESRETAPRLNVEGRSFATVEKDLPSNHRTDVRRRRKRLAEKGHVSLWQPSTLDEANSVLTELFRVHDEKWLAEGFPGMFQDARVQSHFRAILRSLWGQGMHLSTVRCGDTDVSYSFGFIAGGWFQWFRPAYRSEFFGYSPGKIHVALLVEEACRLQMKGIDFLLGEEGYKNLWSNGSMEVISFHAGFHEWAPSYLWFAKGKPYVKSRLAGDYMRARAWLQKMRKKD
jgi:CelD/BcsL family acetyltransferase involved in cellulose biosynthesis